VASRTGFIKGLLSGVVIIGALGYAGSHSEGMDAPAAPVTPASEVVDPTPAPDVCAALRDAATKHGQRIDDCHSYTERTVG
jgi:hypothetical protein